MSSTYLSTAGRLVLAADTAEELMTPNPISIGAGATVQEVLVLMTDKGVSAAPVIDEAGRPIGVVSRSDLLLHERETTKPASDEPRMLPVSEIMTPVILSIRPDTPAAEVVEQLLGLHVNRLFVVDDSGVLVGAVSTTDVLRRLQPEAGSVHAERMGYS